jgi:hypothetical protein
MYDNQIGRFFTQDNYSEKYLSLNPYQYAANSPITNIDINGDSVWVTTAHTYNKKGEITSTTHTLHATIKILDVTGKVKDLKGMAEEIQLSLMAAFSGFTQGALFTTDIQVKAVKSMDEVGEGDHLIAFVDDVKGKSAKGGEAGGLADMKGKMAYVQLGDRDWMVETSVHEFGHNLGLRHTFEDPRFNGEPKNNYMSYDRGSQLRFDGVQIMSVYEEARKGNLNTGSNYTMNYTPNNGNPHGSSNELPFRGIINANTKMPAILCY